MTDILLFGVLFTHFLVAKGVKQDAFECVREPIGPINSTTLSGSMGHSKFHICAPITEAVHTQGDAQGVSGEASIHGTSQAATHEEIVDIMRAQILEIIDVVLVALTETKSKLMSQLTDIETRLGRVEAMP